jgi:CTP:molybdopterin cytidylyltransferase MocA
VKVTAVLLAAGEGRRMGGPKALLPLGQVSFLEACLTALLREGVGGAVVVIGHEAARVRAVVPPWPNVAVAENPDYAKGMLSSVRRGLDAAEAAGADAILLHPVDHPLVEPETVDRVVAALRQGAVIAVPSHERRRGHPGGFARAAFAALRAAPDERGARAVLEAHADWVVHVTGGPGSRAGFDTPKDLRRLL